MNYIVIGQLLLVVMFIISASMKFARTRSMVRHWKEYRYPMWFMSVTASLELLGVIGLIAAVWIPELLKAAALLLAVLMIGAMHAHFFRAKHKPVMALNALLMFVIAAALLLT
ncbi:DoxX family protein [Paenibacillus mesophilus]|uniref:DoxX family protein n=1 Tax=Paenibacillus mesophilus TaxID=2582849 RepID=UPI00110F046A|nr:DoxX family protein [Paenibacillus mesophilus]TMV52345.1 DoxX family protein [Paenibacillus mesophilus]